MPHASHTHYRSRPPERGVPLKNYAIHNEPRYPCEPRYNIIIVLFQSRFQTIHTSRLTYALQIPAPRTGGPTEKFCHTSRTPLSMRSPIQYYAVSPLYPGPPNGARLEPMHYLTIVTRQNFVVEKGCLWVFHPAPRSGCRVTFLVAVYIDGHPCFQICTTSRTPRDWNINIRNNLPLLYLFRLGRHANIPTAAKVESCLCWNVTYFIRPPERGVISNF